MKIKSVSLLILAIAILTLQGCAALSTSGDHTLASTAIPDASPMLDHYIAWIPREQAQTATVAEAMAHISLVNARDQTASQLCGGQWMMQGEVAENIGPIPATAPVAAGGYPAWYYRISHRPGLLGCRDTDTQTLYQAMQEYLPDWMGIRAASATTLSRLD